MLEHERVKMLVLMQGAENVEVIFICRWWSFWIIKIEDANYECDATEFENAWRFIKEDNKQDEVARSWGGWEGKGETGKA